MDKKALVWSFFANFCALCASLWQIKHLFSRPKTSMISVNPVILSNYFRVLRVLRGEKIREISVNPWLINDLRSTKDYVRKNILFMQNEPNFQKVKFNVNKVLTRDYDQLDTWSSGKKQSQTNPNKAKLKKAEMNITSIITKGYGNKLPIRAPKKQSQIPKRQKTMQTLLLQRIMKITALSASGKTKPNKPNFKPGSLSAGSFWFQLLVAPAIISPDLVQQDKKLDRLLYIGDRYES